MIKGKGSSVYHFETVKELTLYLQRLIVGEKRKIDRPSFIPCSTSEKCMDTLERYDHYSTAFFTHLTLGQSFVQWLQSDMLKFNHHFLPVIAGNYSYALKQFCLNS